MHIAAVNNDLESFAMLLNAGGNLYIHVTRENIEPLLITASKSNSASVARFMLYKHVDVNIVDNHGLTSLHHATSNRDAEMIHSLLLSESSVNIQDKLGKTVLHYLSDITDLLKQPH
jgi:ankyrin repeat protein